MKKYGIMLLALLVCGAVYAAVTTDISIRQVRDPVQLRAIWNASISGLYNSTNVANAATNVTVALTRQAAPSVTNVTVQTATLTYLSATGVTSTVTVVTGIVNQAASVAALTNAVLTIQKP